MQPRVLLLSAYTARSHGLWAARLQAMFPHYHWTSLNLPPRHFSWRIRGNSLLWAFSQRALLEQPYDLLLATSMVDLSTLRGFVPALTRIPTVLYFHENQFAYPTASSHPHNLPAIDNIEPKLVPLYGALCADRIVFNSHYNRDTFIAGARSLFKKLPDSIPGSIMTHLQGSRVLPVPIAAGSAPLTRKPSSDFLDIIWNHRWEYDKGIDLLLHICHIIRNKRLRIRLHIAGEQFRQCPAEFQQIDTILDAHAQEINIQRGQFGFIPQRQQYDALLARCDVVLSTARHDFQGLAVQEACMAGCTPLAPNALVYPEYLDTCFLYAPAHNNASTATAVCEQLSQWQNDKYRDIALPKADLQQFSEARVRPGYAALFAELLPE